MAKPDKAAKKAAKAEKAAKGGKEKGDKEKNPVLLQARAEFAKGLKAQGVAEDQIKVKVKAHMKDVVKPAMSEAKKTASEKKLKGAEKKKFVQEALRAKLGLQSQAA